MSLSYPNEPDHSVIGILIIVLVVFGGLITCSKCEAKTIKVAIIDTGFDFYSSWPYAHTKNLVRPKLCETGHWDFVYGHDKPIDYHGHGTHVAGILAKELKDADYCLVILKFFDPNKPSNNLKNMIASFKKAYELGVDYVNLSGGGIEYSQDEKDWVIKLLDKGVHIAAAAGNERTKMDNNAYYPAMYDSRIIVAAATDKSGRILASSNYGSPVDYYLPGENIYSLLPDNSYGPMTGTSQATPKALGIVIKEHIEIIERVKFIMKNPNVMRTA